MAKKYKGIQLDRSRTKYWLGVGAQPSDPVWRLLSLVGVLIDMWRIIEGFGSFVERLDEDHGNELKMDANGMNYRSVSSNRT